MKTIRDAIHGYIELNQLELKLLDTEYMQRLRRVRQLGFTNLVYPSATHSRFEHSIGSFEIAKKFGKSLDLDKRDKQEVKIAALLHDIGHLPFSHATEEVLENSSIGKHENISEQKIKETEISELLEENGLSPQRIADLIHGKGVLGGLVSGRIDADRMDYLQRDAHYTGVAHGTIESDTIIKNIRLQDGNLMFTKKGLTSLESLLVARYLMLPTVYLHHASIIAETMLKEAVSMSLGNVIQIEDLKHMDDWELIYELQNSNNDGVKELIQRIKQRRLYKRALVIPPSEIGREEFKKACENIEQDREGIRREVKEKAGVKKSKVLIDIFRPGSSGENGTRVMHGDGTVSLKELSPITKEIEKSLWNHAAIRVYAPKDSMEDIEKVSRNVLNSFLD